MVNTERYACAGYINGRICSNNHYVRRDRLEAALLADIKAGLLGDGVVSEIERRIRRGLQSQTTNNIPVRVGRLEGEIANMVSAIGEGLISPALRQRLQAAEAELERLKTIPKPVSVELLLPRLPEIIRTHVRELERLAQREPVRARAAVRQALEADTITIRPAEAGRGVVAEFGLVRVQLMTGTSSESVVAGAGFEPATFGL